MKKKDILISLVIIAVSAGVLYFYVRRTGYIQVDAGKAGVTLQLQSSLFGNTTIRSGPEPTEVHARVHRPENLRLSLDQNGHHCLILSIGPWGNLGQINVKNKQTAILRLGPPLIIKPKVRKNGPMVTIEFDVVGQAGEQYEKFVRRDNRTIAGARLKIVDEAGNVLESGEFRYG
ncbi:MAG: hypothetical protein A2Z25_11665 [Planctomycetes bacterium RBG_16_55_9]|nr:MAG: hypothetical protein A2Z25_11665 [Planctomycetes bacterium RBG_16_55_9]